MDDGVEKPKYKIELKEIKSLRERSIPDNYDQEQVAEIQSWQARLVEHMKMYDHLISLREKIAEASDVYLEMKFGQLTISRTRELLVKGCESEIESIVENIREIQSEIRCRIRKY